MKQMTTRQSIANVVATPLRRRTSALIAAPAAYGDTALSLQQEDAFAKD